MREHFEPMEPDTYRTGSTNPPKKGGCLIAFLLMVAIFSIGIVSSLGLLNFRLLRRIEISDPNETVSIVVSDPVDQTTPVPAAKIGEHEPLGITGESLSLLYQMYYRLPSGLLITAVAPDSVADRVGIAPGDILLQVENVSVTHIQELETVLSAYQPGDTVTLVIYRLGKQYSVPITLEEACG